MSENAEDTTLSQLTLFAGDSPARTYRWPVAAKVWLERDRDSGLSSIEFLRSLRQDGLSSRMSLACCPLTTGKTLASSFEGWRNSGICRPGESWTLNTSEWPSDAAVCSLSDILETDVPQRYFLSRRAAQGILRRAEKRGRELPELLRLALEAVALDGQDGTRRKD